MSRDEVNTDEAGRLRGRVPYRPLAARRADALKGVIRKQSAGDCWLRTLLERRKPAG